MCDLQVIILHVSFYPIRFAVGQAEEPYLHTNIRLTKLLPAIVAVVHTLLISVQHQVNFRCRCADVDSAPDNPNLHAGGIG